MHYNQIAGHSLERLAALSDGVFAVGMTLLVLDMHLPAVENIHNEHELLGALASMLPKLVPYMMSFMTLGIYWVGQQTQLNYFTHSDRNLAWIQLAFLFMVTLMPLSTALLSEFITYRTALLVYWFNIVLLGTTLLFSWRYARKAGLVSQENHEELDHAVVERILTGQWLYAFGAFLCVFNTYWSMAFLVAVQINYVVSPLENGLFSLLLKKRLKRPR